MCDIWKSLAQEMKMVPATTLLRNKNTKSNILSEEDERICQNSSCLVDTKICISKLSTIMKKEAKDSISLKGDHVIFIPMYAINVT